MSASLSTRMEGATYDSNDENEIANNIIACFTKNELNAMENILDETLDEASISKMFSYDDLNEMEIILQHRNSPRNQNMYFFNNMDLSQTDSVKRIKALLSDYDSFANEDSKIKHFHPQNSSISLFQDNPQKLFNAFKPQRKKRLQFILDKSLIKGYIRSLAAYFYFTKTQTKIFMYLVPYIAMYWGHLLKNCQKTSVNMQAFLFDATLIKSINDYGKKRYHEIPRLSVLKFICSEGTGQYQMQLHRFSSKVWNIKYSANSIRFKKKTKAKDTRKVGRWFLGPILGKGGYSWVKKGYDRKDGRIVALKFTSKLKKDWSMSQSKQISNEIAALSQIRHKHILKLLGYNLNAKYPQKDGLIIPSVLLVLEYVPGGELFDILYYTSALHECIARTYFQQMMDGVEALHAVGICHRDIKPQNLLLDSNFQLKIVDFGLSKVFEKDEDYLMKTYYIGTKGYQAPEILRKKPYTVACDVFSCGVVLFILLSAYPPFEAASRKCRWYAPLIDCNSREFWKQHRGCGINAPAKDLITRMLWYDYTKRISIAGIKRHKWYNGRSLSQQELVQELRILHREMEIKRSEDAEKQKQLQYSNRNSSN